MKTKTSWAALLQQELAKLSERFTPEHKTVVEIKAEFKKAGMPYGDTYIYKFLRRLLAEGKATSMKGQIIGPSGYKVNCVKYLIK